MFDKMHLRTFSLIDEINLIKLGYRQGHGDGQYRKLFRLELSPSKVIIVKTCPYYPSAGASIELNPGRFEDWNEVMSNISLIADQESFIIDRLDHAVDLPIPYERLRETLRICRKQNRDSYREVDASKGRKLTGFKSGERPEVFCIYDKGYEVTRKFKFKRVPGTDVGVSTRIEIRHYNKKIAFPLLADIKNYLKYDPFEKIECYELRNDLEKSDKIMRLRRDIQLVGFEGIYLELNESGNFKRTHGKYFNQKPLSNELRELYQLKVRRFIGADAKVARSSMATGLSNLDTTKFQSRK